MSSEEDNRVSEQASALHSSNNSCTDHANGASGDKSNGSAESNMDVTGSPKESGKPLSTVSPVKSDEGNSSFEDLNTVEFVDMSSLADVMNNMRRAHYDSQKVDGHAEGKCNYYFRKDYFCEMLANKLLCKNYPREIIIPVAVKQKGIENKGSRVKFNIEDYEQQVSYTPHARLRSRFAAPVILFDNKFISRSGTLTCKKSSVYEQTAKPSASSDPAFDALGMLWNAIVAVYSKGKQCMDAALTLLDWNAMQKFFTDDVVVLNQLGVKHVCDLMVEYRKIVCDAVNVSSCELLHMDIYRHIKIEDMPYPGCEFFKLYKEAGRNPEGLMFDWSAPEVTRELELHDDLSSLIPDLDVSEMKEWDLIELTKKYLKIMLAFLVKDKGGILVHCISGWDRTPLFISLLRLSLWADGVIHTRLDSDEIAYLTVAYDWYLFGHNLPNRLKKGEEIMHFCFNFLLHIATDEFSVTKMFKRLPADERKFRNMPDFEPGRRRVLNDVRRVVLDQYRVSIIECLGTEEKIEEQGTEEKITAS